MIGDYCFVFKEALPYTVVTLYPTKLLRVPLDELKVRFSDEQLLDVVDNLKLYPKDVDILKIFNEKARWSDFCDNVIQ